MFEPTSLLAGFLAGLLICGAIAAVLAARQAPDEPGPAPVDPWRLQRKLMDKSDQEIPVFPRVTDNSLLYYALMLEEMAETGEGLLKALKRAWGPQNPGRTDDLPLSDEAWISRVDYLAALKTAVGSMEYGSGRLRSILKRARDPEVVFRVDLTADEAVELLDGTTDVAVVNAGFALACGLPGPEAYLEVQLSNLSKANPDTGMIDKEPDGKWIKGPNFYRPNLALVLEASARAK